MINDKVQEAYNKMLEAESYKDNMTISDVLKNADNMWYNQLKDAYYGVSDNIGKLTVLLATETKLSKDYNNIKSALQYFKKMKLGKYL